MKRDDLLMFADSEHDANMLYAVGMFVPDPFIYLRIRGRPYIVLSDLEIDRARQQARRCRVLSLSQCQRRLRGQGISKPNFAQVIRGILRTERVKRLSVPYEFPIGLARELRRLKVKVRVKERAVFPERELKTAEEVKKISAALMMAEVGLAEGLQALKTSKIGKNAGSSIMGSR